MKYNKSATLRFAFKQSLPVLFGYLFLGAAFGIMLFKAGYNWVWAALISLLVYAGSGQFLLVSLISSGAGLGSLLSAALPMDFTGIDFSMTALFVVIFIDLIRNQKGRAGLIGALGLCAGILCLLIFGADKFLLPSLVLTVAVLSAGRPFFDPERRAAK